jgi:hypothetical protein
MLYHQLCTAKGLVTNMNFGLALSKCKGNLGYSLPMLQGGK